MRFGNAVVGFVDNGVVFDERGVVIWGIVGIVGRREEQSADF